MVLIRRQIKTWSNRRKRSSTRDNNRLARPVSLMPTGMSNFFPSGASPHISTLHGFRVDPALIQRAGATRPTHKRECHLLPGTRLQPQELRRISSAGSTSLAGVDLTRSGLCLIRSNRRSIARLAISTGDGAAGAGAGRRLKKTRSLRSRQGQCLSGLICWPPRGPGASGRS